MAGERGQATIEWTAVVLTVALAFAAAVGLGVPHLDGRSYGGFVAHAIFCAVGGGCDEGRDDLTSAYGPRDAALVRRYTPSIVYEPGEKEIPVDYRLCRTPACGDAPDDRSLDVSHTDAGVPATAFTHVLHRDGETFLQYWFYFPDSNTTWAGSDKAWKVGTAPLELGHKLWRKIPKAPRYLGFHRDDWEGYQVRVDTSGNASVRATAHRGYRWCKQSQCRNQWGAWTGWTRVSRGSHAGHIPLRSRLGGIRFDSEAPFVGGRYVDQRPAYPGVDLRERTTVGADLNLVPLERVDQSGAPSFEDISPPWEKPVYLDPLSNAT